MAKFKDKLRRGEAVIGTWINISGPAIIEIIGRTGFDFLLIDGEHSPFNENDLREAVESFGVPFHNNSSGMIASFTSDWYMAKTSDAFCGS